jgi:hypothetical protein
MNKPQKLVRNSSFVLGLACMIAFMSSGFLFTLGGTLLFSSLWFVLAPIPFGVFFAFASNALLQTNKEKKKTNAIKLQFIMLIIIITLITIIYYFLMSWFAYKGHLQMI